MRAPVDPLELLFSGATPAAAEEALRLTTFLRLLADDARGGGPRVEVDAAGAAGEWAARARARALDALVDLLRINWRTCLEEDSFLDAEPATLEHQAAWSRLESVRREGTAVPEIPGPGEPALAVAQRLLGAAESLGMDALERGHWETRLALIEERDPALARAHWTALARGAAAPGLVEAALADAAACLLDRGAVHAARDLLAAQELTPGARAETLASWCRTLAGERDDSLFVGAAGGVPTPLLELRAERSDLLPALAGAPTRGRRGAGPALRSVDRAALGASVLLVVRFAGGRAEIARAALAPGQGGDPTAHLRGRRRPWTRAGAPEHELLLTAAPVVRRGPGVDGLADDTRALALVPLLGQGSELTGWLHLEWRHLLVPSRARLRALAASVTEHVHTAPEFEVALDEEHGAARAVFDSLMADLGTKTHHRRWTGLVVEGDRITRVAGGGAGMEGASEPGAGQALQRAWTTGGVARFDAPDAALSLDRRAASGMVFPASLDGEVVALLAIESTRRRDFRNRDATRVAAAVDAHALDLRCAAFDAWHRRRYGHGLGFAPAVSAFRRCARQVRLAARARASVMVVGPAGSGRGTVARWLHFESGRRDAPLVEVRACDLERLPELGPGAGVLVRDLDASGSAALTALLEAGRRLLVTGLRPPDALAADGLLDGRVAAALGRFPLHVPPLAGRREELPCWVSALRERFGESEEVDPIQLTDDALALLWRQPWEGEFPELENALYRLTLDRAGETVDAETLAGVLAGFGTELLGRLPSRHPRREDVAAALAVTRRASGRTNKTRAALYLGWDPDTLVARMKDLGLEG